MERVKIVLKSGKDQSMRRFHPWVFSGAIKKIYGNVAEGDVVDVFDNKDEFLGLGHYQIGSIMVRIISFEQTEVDKAFWLEKMNRALAMRKSLKIIGNDETNIFRLINAEGDGMPGLIIDYYNGTAIMQFHSVGMYLIREILAECLREVMGSSLESIYDKSENTLPVKARLNPKDGYMMGKSTKGSGLENGLMFNVNWEEGQKTGFFIDQRESRMLVEKYSQGRSVLNMFSYTGGFSVYALRGGASLVHTVDSSAKAIDMANQNVKLNFEDDGRHTSFAMDAFDFFTHPEAEYDLVILDPPAFAKHNDVLHNALQGYKRLNQRAFEMIKPGGMLFTFSCSQVVTRENFRKSVFAAAANARRDVKILYQLSQPIDHPVSIYHPEGEYLKGLVLMVY